MLSTRHVTCMRGAIGAGVVECFGAWCRTLECAAALDSQMTTGPAAGGQHAYALCCTRLLQENSACCWADKLQGEVSRRQTSLEHITRLAQRRRGRHGRWGPVQRTAASVHAWAHTSRGLLVRWVNAPRHCVAARAVGFGAILNCQLPNRAWAVYKAVDRYSAPTYTCSVLSRHLQARFA